MKVFLRERIDIGLQVDFDRGLCFQLFNRQSRVFNYQRETCAKSDARNTVNTDPINDQYLDVIARIVSRIKIKINLILCFP
jgi:hypothetical protein